ncbi:aminotransferase-like domain-containing protein [Planctomicrobium piriforme]|uniref:2-aminoadipate transaminase n=1 Tax=Planctomicrobium piriforme TaxID=1576369 RepID=A0A1I3CZ97_9PLAN|nr:PLP-dependent aminotransferase family protein [Planctomicrobium piriforme]SFH79860.1 2-aminoadipate transaminase [Planctomicrobium piriforme]
MSTKMDVSHSSLPVRFSQRRQFTSELAISFLMQQAVENPLVISLAAGLVDPQTLPVAEVLQATTEMLASETVGKGALQYGTTAGYVRLRRLLLDHFAQLEKCSVEQLGIGIDRILLTTGSQQLLSLVCEVLFDPGDICLVAGPTYFVFAGNLAGVGARTVTIPSDEHGMQIDALDQALNVLHQAGDLPRVKMIYVVSYYDNPAGTCLSEERSRQLAAVAKKWSRDHQIFILEDAAYRELRYDGPEYPSVWSMDESREQVIYTQTFSKTFSPGIRVGFGIVPSALVQPLADRKGNEDFGSSNFAQHLMAGVLQQGLYASHLVDVKHGYKLKRDAMLIAAKKYFSKLPGVTWRHPHGGLYVWMSLPENIPTSFRSDLFRRAVEAGVMYVPGEICYADSPDSRPNHQMRLSFGVQTPEGIDEGMRRLSIAVQSCL